MRSLVALALAIVCTVACKEKQKPPPAQPPEPARPAVPAKPLGMPAPCVDYIVAIDKLKACTTAPDKAALMAQFEGDRDVLSGVKHTPREDLEAMCMTRAPAVKHVVDTQCTAPADPRDLPALKAEAAKLQATIDAAEKLLGDPSAPDSARIHAKTELGAAQQQKADLEELIRQRQCREDPSAAGC